MYWWTGYGEAPCEATEYFVGDGEYARPPGAGVDGLPAPGGFINLQHLVRGKNRYMLLIDGLKYLTPCSVLLPTRHEAMVAV